MTLICIRAAQTPRRITTSDVKTRRDGIMLTEMQNTRRFRYYSDQSLIRLTRETYPRLVVVSLSDAMNIYLRKKNA